MNRQELIYPGDAGKGAQGIGVKRLQEWLNYHRCYINIDADFGPATETALRKFQAIRGLVPCGVLDSQTWEDLVEPMRRVLVMPALPSDAGLSKAVLQIAKLHLAQHPVELGGDNRGPWVRLYMDGHEGAEWRWCAGFVTFVLKQACSALSLAMPVPGSFGCDELARQAKQSGRFQPGAEADWRSLGSSQIFLIRKTESDWTHTGFSFAGNGAAFSTIEGNTNDEGGSNGYEVTQRVRSTARADFIRLD